jgi:hypothetical protein
MGIDEFRNIIEHRRDGDDRRRHPNRSCHAAHNHCMIYVAIAFDYDPDEAGVAMVHGSVFGLGPYIRIAYALGQPSFSRSEL